MLRVTRALLERRPIRWALVVAIWLVRLRLWECVVAMRQPTFIPCRGTRWLFSVLCDVQAVDNLHHAPACPANHYHRARLVTGPCTCGATESMGEGASRRRYLPAWIVRRLPA